MESVRIYNPHKERERIALTRNENDKYMQDICFEGECLKGQSVSIIAVCVADVLIIVIEE